jgi:uncharacterized damage-inducible protein DinB
MRTEPPYAGDERTQLDAWLDWHRGTVYAKCAGLSTDDAWRAPLPASPLVSAAGLVSHLTWVERHWFEGIVAGGQVRWPGGPDDPDAEFRRLGDEGVAEVLARYAAQCERSREIARGLPLDGYGRREWRGARVALRYVMLHLIEETARHNGHLDAVRELVDGVTGE